MVSSSSEVLPMDSALSHCCPRLKTFIVAKEARGSSPRFRWGATTDWLPLIIPEPTSPVRDSSWVLASFPSYSSTPVLYPFCHGIRRVGQRERKIQRSPLYCFPSRNRRAANREGGNIICRVQCQMRMQGHLFKNC